MSAALPVAPLAAAAPVNANAPASDRLAIQGRTRLLVLLLTLVAFAHVAFGLGAKDLWWDESLSLQRAESAWGPLLRGTLLIKDGFVEVPTTDQHPFFSFLLQGLLVRGAGTSETVLRWPAAAAATLLVPAMVALARLLARRDLVAPSATLWAALLTALSPFLLWYGQEARPYTLWALLSVLSTWLLFAALDAVDDASPRPRHSAGRLWVGYGVALAMLLTTHYYAAFLLPVHALFVYTDLAQRHRARATQIALLLLAGAAAMAALALWIVLSQGGGGNFPSISLPILVPDLVNAFSLGLSVNIEQVRWLHIIFALLAVLGAANMMHSRTALRAGGWVIPAWLLTPIGLVLLGNLFLPLYMNARHLSLLAPAWLLLVAAGLAALGERRRWLPWLPAALILGGFAFSTWNYYTQEAYAKDDYSSLGAYMAERMVPGDLILFYPPSSWRIFDYYLDMDRVYAARDGGAAIAVYGVPLLESGRDTWAWLAEATQQARRTWVIKSGTHPYYDLEGKVEAWMRENLVQLRDVEFFSHSSLRAQLYVPNNLTDESGSRDVPNATDVTFADNIHLIGIDPGWSADPAAGDGAWGLPLPVTLYWQVESLPERRLKYKLALEQVAADGTVTQLGTIEREPFEGNVPTTVWDPGKTIIELAEVPFTSPPDGLNAGRLRASLLLYDAETLEPLAVTQSAGLAPSADGAGVYIPLQGPQP